MSPTRPRLIVLKGGRQPATPRAPTPMPDTPRLVPPPAGPPRPQSAPVPSWPASLISAYELVEVEGVEQAQQMLRTAPDGSMVVTAEMARHLASERDGESGGASALARSALENVGEGAAVVEQGGSVVWCNRRFERRPEPTRARFVELCQAAIEQFNARADLERSPEVPSRKFNLSTEESEYELVISPVALEQGEAANVSAVVGVLWDVTTSRRLQQRIDAIDAAGSELMTIEADSIRTMDMAARLRLLEDKIVHFVHDLLQFDNFEIRLLDRESRQLELVLAVGLAPLKIGEVIFAEPEGNGISGYVASTGRSYICPDVRRDPLYREGLDNAASSLTVPLMLHDQLIGVFNIESFTPNVFDENDRQFAEIFGRYVAMAMNILDLMVVERYTTNAQVAANVLGELEQPVADISTRAEQLYQAHQDNPELREALEHIRDATAAIKRRVEACTHGPRTILGAEQELHRHQPEPLLEGKRILLADDEPRIREDLEQILQQKGCEVTACANGRLTIDAIQEAAARGERFHLVISDIKMPDCNGYEVFRTVRSDMPETPVILTTGFGYDPHHSIVRATQEGLHTFLFKPFQADQLLDAMRKALGERLKVE